MTRIRLDDLTDDQLDTLYEQLEQAELDAEQQERNFRALMNERTSYRGGWKYEQKRRATAEATLNAVRALLPDAQHDSNPTLAIHPSRIRAVLDQHGQTPS